MKIIKVGIAAHSEVKSDLHVENVIDFVKNFGECVKKRNLEKRVYLLVGGYWGLMKILADEALKVGLNVIIIPPCERDAEADFPEEAIVIRTGLSMRGRSIALARSSHVLVSLGGSSGTILEMIAAYTEGVPVYALVSTGLPSDKMGIFSPFIDDRKNARIDVFESPEKLADSLCIYLEELSQIYRTSGGGKLR